MKKWQITDLGQEVYRSLRHLISESRGSSSRFLGSCQKDSATKLKKAPLDKDGPSIRIITAILYIKHICRFISP